jgi:predicted hydrocarbon binding protein
MTMQGEAIIMDPFGFFQLGLEEVLGPKELSKLKTSSNSSAKKNSDASQNQITPIRMAMDEAYGKICASGLAICAGRAAFKHLLVEKGAELGFDDDKYRFLPIHVKIRKGLELLAQWMKDTFGYQITVHPEAKVLNFDIRDVSSGAVPSQYDYMCDFTSGLLQEFLAWLSGGKFYPIHERECKAAGASVCNFQIDRNPLD